MSFTNGLQRRIKISVQTLQFAPMQMGTFIHRVLELTHATLLVEALGCDVLLKLI